MKILLSIFALICSSTASADPACLALSSAVGSYKLVSKTCDGPFGSHLTVTPYDRGTYSGYMITSGGIGIGPTTHTNGTDKCTTTGGSIIVETCVLHDTCRPQGWGYEFFRDQVTFNANGCTANFSKIQ